MNMKYWISALSEKMLRTVCSAAVIMVAASNIALLFDVSPLRGQTRIFGKIDWGSDFGIRQVGGTFKGPGAGTFSLHSGADLFETPDYFVDTEHWPKAQPAANNIFPMRTYPKQLSPLEPVQTFATWVTPPQTYATDMKAANVFSTDAALLSVNRPDLGGSVLTAAQTGIVFKAGAKGGFSVAPDPTNYTVEIVRTGNGLKSVSARAGALAIDPITYSVVPGDTLTGVVTLPAGILAQITDSDGTVATTFEIGANLPGLSFGGLPPSMSGNPLLFQLNLSFTHSSSEPGIDAEFNSSPLLIFSKGDGSSLPIGMSVHDYVTNLLQTSIEFDPTEHKWSLPIDLNLFQYESNINTSMDNLTIDVLTGQVAQVPEPAGGTLLLIGFSLMRRRPCLGRRSRWAGQ